MNRIFINNCPCCKTGIQEPYKVLRIDENGVLKSRDYESADSIVIGDIVMSICSLNECGHTEMVAAQGTLEQAKNIRRKRKFSTIGSKQN